MINTSRFITLLFALLVMMPLIGCNSKTADSGNSSDASKHEEEVNSQSSTTPDVSSTVEEKKPVGPGIIELDAEQLLAARLPRELAREGWVRLFDGMTTFGLQMAGSLWRIEDGTLVADAGERGLICTNTRWLNYVLTLEFKATEETNSGIFLRTPLFPRDPASDCYELNIAPADNPFPTGGLVKRMKVEPEDIGELDFDVWHRYDIVVDGGNVRVKLDGKQILEYVDPNPLPAGLVGLQYNSGPIAFRDVRIKPLGTETLLSDEVADNWIRYPEMEGDYQMTDDGLHITGGRAQLESKDSYDDFVLRAEVRTNADDLNSGIFFRCIPGDQMMGYECQICNAIKDSDPLFPADCGTGGFFRRQDARIIAANDNDWFTMMLVADGATMAGWVNGLQVCEWTDDREPHENPRKGKRLEAGTLMLQAHDPTTDIHVREFAIARLDPIPDAAKRGAAEEQPSNSESSEIEPSLNSEGQPDDESSGSGRADESPE